MGNVIDSSTTGLSGSQIVSPVVECFRPTTATMSPVYAASRSSRWLACICRTRPMRSLRSFVRVQHVGAAVQHAGVDAQVGEPPDVGVAHDLERERRERLGVVGLAHDVLVLLEGLVALDRRHVERAGQVVHDRVEHELHALVLERRAAEHRDTLARQGGAADRAAELLDGGLLLGDELLHQGFVVVGELLEELVARGLGRCPCTPRGSRCPSSPRPSRLPSSGPSSRRGR